MNREIRPIVGLISLIVIGTVLCMTILALLGISGANASDRMAREAAEAAEKYYAADKEAEIIFAEIRSGKIPEGVKVENGEYSYVLTVSDIQKLYVTVRSSEGGWTVLRWQTVSEVGYDEKIDLWDGQITN